MFLHFPQKMTQKPKNAEKLDPAKILKLNNMYLKNIVSLEKKLSAFFDLISLSKYNRLICICSCP